MMQAMIFAAGLGTRLKPLTDTMPKALVRVGGEPLIKRVIMNLAAAGVDRIVVNVHHFAEQIIDYLKDNDNFGLDIRISDETAGLLETGGGIKKATPLFDPAAPILIHNVDILSNVDLREFYQIASQSEKGKVKSEESEGGSEKGKVENEEGRGKNEESNCCDAVDAVLLVSWRKTKRYLLFNDDMKLVGWTNIETGEVRSPYPDLDPKKCRMYAFAGIHALSPRLLKMMDEFPDRFGIIDFYLKACATHNIKGYVKDDLKLMDIGKLDTLAQAEEFLEELGDRN
ncbi:nucleotidyltransferase family protein [uncultured Prevotella sp.]|uniref:nucleotidyltransferase family protein n=1 Tax=uncultured Prevotella sp. TaxID=159272 RepID=UPI0026748A1A|nr:nucleotidyltransferase family protein [uncultured Prevotella sp.]